MAVALEQAELAASHGDVPVGCAVMLDGAVLATGANRRELDRDPTAHAEVVALRAAAAALGSWRLDGAEVFVTLEPCAMCAGALLQARVAKVVFAATDPKAGALGSLYHLGADPRLNHAIEVEVGDGEEQASALLRSFFAARR